jgi:hypothetical protein
MTLPETGHVRPYLTGAKLLIALVIVAVVAVVTLWLTGLPEAVIVVVAPLLVIIGVDRYGQGAS